MQVDAPTVEMMRARLATIRTGIDQAARQSGRDPALVEIMVAGKYADASTLAAVLAAGVTLVGENQVQMAESKLPLLRTAFPQVSWQLIGHLQSNKARRAVAMFDAIHSLDSLALAKKLSALSQEASKVMPVLIQVNLAGESTKSGVAVEDLADLAKAVTALPGLALNGLMTMPPAVDQAAENRPYFRQLAVLRSELEQALAVRLPTLSMGTSQDYLVAVEEGSTMVRLGSALFAL